MKINNFRGERTDSSAKKEALVADAGQFTQNIIYITNITSLDQSIPKILYIDLKTKSLLLMLGNTAPELGGGWTSTARNVNCLRPEGLVK